MKRQPGHGSFRVITTTSMQGVLVVDRVTIRLNIERFHLRFWNQWYSWENSTSPFCLIPSELPHLGSGYTYIYMCFIVPLPLSSRRLLWQWDYTLLIVPQIYLWHLKPSQIIIRLHKSEHQSKDNYWARLCCRHCVGNWARWTCGSSQGGHCRMDRCHERTFSSLSWESAESWKSLPGLLNYVFELRHNQIHWHSLKQVIQFLTNTHMQLVQRFCSSGAGLVFPKTDDCHW